MASNYKLESLTAQIGNLASNDEILKFENLLKTYATKDMLLNTESKIEDFVPRCEVARLDMELSDFSKKIASFISKDETNGRLNNLHDSLTEKIE